MGLLVNGKWDDLAQSVPTQNGDFARQPSTFLDVVTADGSSGFKAEPGRYHLYVAYHCPWAWRTILFRKLKKLENVISITFVVPNDRTEGWAFGHFADCGPDEINGFRHLHQAYTAARPGFTGKVTVPVLWDRKTKTIVNNESSQIIRMLNSAFEEFTNAHEDYYPQELRTEIDAVNERVYTTVNNGVYRCGFAATQESYEQAFDLLFATLDWLEARLGSERYLAGGRITEADWRLLATLLRFDIVYNPLFKCNKRTIASYANLSNYMRELYQVSGVAETVKVRHIVCGYYSIPLTNRTGIIPKGPAGYEEWLSQPHDRNRLPSSQAVAPSR